MRLAFAFLEVSIELFQSTHPVWDATLEYRASKDIPLISIHASRMGCDCRVDAAGHGRFISIHASRMGCDQSHRLGGTLTCPISIHASRMGCDLMSSGCTSYSRQFQSTHPVWDATVTADGRVTEGHISIHASRMGCDRCGSDHRRNSSHFNPRIPYGMRLE